MHMDFSSSDVKARENLKGLLRIELNWETELNYNALLLKISQTGVRGAG